MFEIYRALSLSNIHYMIDTDETDLCLLMTLRTMFEIAPKRSESNFSWQPFFSSSWQTLYSKTL